MTFWLIVVAVNVVIHAVAVTIVRRPLAADIELTPSDAWHLSDEHRNLVDRIGQQAALRGFRWFGVVTVKTWRDKPAQPATIWWNGDIGAWLVFESIGRKWNLDLSFDLEDGSMVSVSKIPFAHLSPPPGAVLISKSTVGSFDELWVQLPVDLRDLPTVRGWPGPGQEWYRTVARRELMLGHWISTGRAARTDDGRGIRVAFRTANAFVVLAGFGVRHALTWSSNRRAREHLLALRSRQNLGWSAQVPVGHPG